MKIILQTLFLSFYLLSCSNNKQEQKDSLSNDKKKSNNSIVKKHIVSQRFSKKVDTLYKINSLNIECLQRQFYSYCDDSLFGKKIQIVNVTSKNRINNFYWIRLYESIKNPYKSKTAHISFKDKFLLKKAFESMKIVANNSGKNLFYNIGDYEDSYLRTDHTGNGVYLWCMGNNNESIEVLITKSEIDSMQSCFNRFLKEK